jgi:hypothetical protein
LVGITRRSNLDGFIRRFNFDEMKWGRLLEKNTVATWNLGTVSAFA